MGKDADAHQTTPIMRHLAMAEMELVRMQIADAVAPRLKDADSGNWGRKSQRATIPILVRS